MLLGTLDAKVVNSLAIIERSVPPYRNLVRGVDQPIAALITDLKQRGLPESTLIVWCCDFGRTPDSGVRGGTDYAETTIPTP